jgi:KDO2-lipid IV(A) lauroyltransferase
MSKHGPLRNLAEYALAWPVLKCLEWSPLAVARAGVDVLSSGLYAVTPVWRRVAETNLRLAFPEADFEARNRIIRGVYRSLGRVALAVARMPRLNTGNISDWIRYEGFEHYETALSRGNGVLFMTAHLGNWELSAFAHALFGHPMHVMVRPLDNPWLDRLLEAHRTSCGNHTIRKQDSARTVFQLLRRNEAVGILVDQNAAGEDGVFVDFFGVKASATAGLVKIALRTGAAVVPGFAFWQPAEKRYVLRFYPPLEMASGEGGDAEVVAYTQKCQSFLENVIREHPDQWLWIHRRWKTRPPGEPPLY